MPMALSDLFARLRKDEDDADAGAADLPVHPTKALARQRVLLDLGPVVGRNVTFFGEEVGCKILVEDLSKDIDQYVNQSRVEDLPSFLDKRFPQ